MLVANSLEDHAANAAEAVNTNLDGGHLNCTVCEKSDVGLRIRSFLRSLIREDAFAIRKFVHKHELLKENAQD